MLHSLIVGDTSSHSVQAKRVEFNGTFLTRGVRVLGFGV